MVTMQEGVEIGGDGEIKYDTDSWDKMGQNESCMVHELSKVAAALVQIQWVDSEP